MVIQFKNKLIKEKITSSINNYFVLILKIIQYFVLILFIKKKYNYKIKK